jgi:VIT1/CCC1 family predicted Fe2+/Mn2+ transporter
VDVPPDRYTIAKHIILSKIFGLTFTIKLLERKEKYAQEVYEDIARGVPGAEWIIKDEKVHEEKLIEIVREEKLEYVGSMILGLNDALVELTGTLAGLTFAFQNSALVGLAGLITGIAASLSMASSEYLSMKSEPSSKSPIKASLYTGAMYLLTVSVLVAPFFVFDSSFMALGVTVLDAVLVIIIFTYFLSVVRELPFKRRFTEMASISLGVAGASFIIGMALRHFLGIEV